MKQVSNSSGISPEAILSRRRLLKILVASSGAVATAAMLPEKWVEPVVEAGVLPAHANISI